MGKIICATRGGEASYRTQDCAIELTKERGDELVFVFVADDSFLNNIAAPLVVDVEARLEKMGRFQLAMAQERAAAQGLTAEAIVRCGRLQAELIAVANELEADIIVLGRPQDQYAVFDEMALQNLATGLKAVTCADVHIL